MIQANNTYQTADTFSKVLGSHTIEVRRRISCRPSERASHRAIQRKLCFFRNGNWRGLRGFSDWRAQPISTRANSIRFYARNKYVGLFAQDSWHVLPSLTLNYGLRWDRIAPWSEKYNQISTFEAGAQSVVFPGAPAGILYPGDPGVPRHARAGRQPGIFAARGRGMVASMANRAAVGKAAGVSRNNQHSRQLRQFLHRHRRAFYQRAGRECPLRNHLYQSCSTAFCNAVRHRGRWSRTIGQPFPYTFAPLNSSRSHPDGNIDWSIYEPISGIPGYDIHNRTPYTEEWMLSVERQAGPDTVFSASYIGTSSHRQRVLIEPNPGNPALCLSLSQPGEVQPGTLTCGANGEDTVYYPIGGGQVNGTRGPLGPNFGSNALQSTIGRANYNALELSARHTSGAPRVLRRLYLQQISGSVVEYRRGGQSIQSRAQLCAVVIRRSAQLRFQL